MNALIYKLRRVLRKRSAVFVAVAVALVFLLQFSSLLSIHENSSTSLKVSEDASSPQLGMASSSDKGKGKIEDEDEDATVPFYRSHAAKASQSLNSAQARKKKLQQLALMEGDRSGSRLALGQKLFNQVFDSLKKGEPKVPALDRYSTTERIYHAGFDGQQEVVFTEEYLKSFLNVTQEEVASLRESHSAVVTSLPETIPKGLYKGNGVVYVGGGKFNWLTLLSIKSLRSLGSTLPVEVLIPTEDEYEEDLCTRIFPALDAKCILLSHALGEDAMAKFTFKGYQYKALALIVSSFENVLLLDSDNIPVHAPDYLFDNEPFISSGLITWPDFWRRATSPHYYDIAGIKVRKQRVRFGYEDRDKDATEVSFHDRKGAIPDPTTESGQLMISKTTHARELFLALYYNLYGPDYYYPLFSQGSDGEGDKETFLAATVALKGPSYQVKKNLNAFGHFNIDHDFIGCAMGQYDPVEDYNLDESKRRLEKMGKDLEDQDESPLPMTKDPRILFVHANFPKLNPVMLKEEGKVFETTGDRIRLYGPGMAKRVGYDFELVQWRNMHFLVCELKIEVEAFKGQDYNTVCKEIVDQMAHLEATVKDNEK